LVAPVALLCALPFGPLNYGLASPLPSWAIAAACLALGSVTAKVIDKHLRRLAGRFRLPELRARLTPEMAVAEMVEGLASRDQPEEGEVPELMPWRRREAERELREALEDSVPKTIRGAQAESERAWSRFELPARLLGKLLTPAQRLVADFLVAGLPGLLPSVGRLYWLWPIVCIALTVLYVNTRSPYLFLPFMICTVTGCVLTVRHVCWVSWPGLMPYPMGRQCVPTYALMPMPFDRVSAVVLKTMLVRFLLYAPHLFLYTWLLGYGNTRGFLGQAWYIGLEIGSRCVLTLLGLLPLTLTWRMSPRSSSRVLTLPRLLLGLLCMLPFIPVWAAGLVVVWATWWPRPVAGTLIMLAGGSAYWLVRRWRHNRSREDLVVPLIGP